MHLQSARIAALAAVPVILGCALFDATRARAAPFDITFDQVGNDLVATGSGNIETEGLNRGSNFTTNTNVIPSLANVSLTLTTGSSVTYFMDGANNT